MSLNPLCVRGSPGRSAWPLYRNYPVSIPSEFGVVRDEKRKELTAPLASQSPLSSG